MFLYGFYRSMKYHCQYSTPFLYQFSYEGAFNVFKNALGEQNMPGACHGDELGYLFHMSFLPTKDELPSDCHALVMRKTFVKMWTNFVKTG